VGTLLLNELAAGLAVVKRRAGGERVQGEMSFRLCEEASYLQAIQCSHDVSGFGHSASRSQTLAPHKEVACFLGY